MPRYVAFLRGVTPMNARMPALKACFEAAGFTDVRTLLSSGNIAFNCPPTAAKSLEAQAEAAMRVGLGRVFRATLRSLEHLQRLVEADPFAEFDLPAQSKHVVTFLHRPPAPVPLLPIERDGVQVLRLLDADVLSSYVPSPKGPVFMRLLERTFGPDITTRTLDTVKRCARG